VIPLLVIAAAAIMFDTLALVIIPPLLFSGMDHIDE